MIHRGTMATAIVHDADSATTSNHTTMVFTDAASLSQAAPSMPSSKTAVSAPTTDSSILEKCTFSTMSNDLLSESTIPSAPSLVPSCHSKKSRSAKSASHIVASKNQAGTNTNSIAVMGMQGSLNRLTDAVVSSLVLNSGTLPSTTTSQLTPSECASNILSDNNELLSMEEQLFMLHYISSPENATTRDVFTGITNPQLCATFMQQLYNKLKNSQTHDEEMEE